MHSRAEYYSFEVESSRYFTRHRGPYALQRNADHYNANKHRVPAEWTAMPALEAAGSAKSEPTGVKREREPSTSPCALNPACIGPSGQRETDAQYDQHALPPRAQSSLSRVAASTAVLSAKPRFAHRSPREPISAAPVAAGAAETDSEDADDARARVEATRADMLAARAERAAVRRPRPADAADGADAAEAAEPVLKRPACMRRPAAALKRPAMADDGPAPKLPKMSDVMADLKRDLSRYKKGDPSKSANAFKSRAYHACMYRGKSIGMDADPLRAAARYWHRAAAELWTHG